MHEKIKKLLKMVNSNNVPNGYKRTEYGIINEKFEKLRIPEVGEFKNGINFSKETGINSIKFLGVGDFGDRTILENTEDLERICVSTDNEKLEPYILKKDDIVFVRSNGSKELVGRNLWLRDISERVVYSGFCIRYRFNPEYKKTSAQYINAWLDNGVLRQMLKKENRGTNINNLNQEILGKLTIYVPEMDEQEKILDIIDNYNKILFHIERLIDYKYKQKRWLVQNLLTGKKRLSGFRDEWKTERLKIFLEEMTEKNKLAIISDVKSISNKSGFINQSEQFGKNVASSDLSNYKIVRKGYIAYNPSRINVGSIALYTEETSGVISPMYVVLKTKYGLHEKYFMYYVKTEEFNQRMKSQLSGSVRETLKFNDLCAIKIDLPSYNEQEQIVALLETADKEIDLLEQKLDLIKQEKKAIMQLLLTGIVRVPQNKKGGF